MFPPHTFSPNSHGNAKYYLEIARPHSEMQQSSFLLAKLKTMDELLSLYNT